MLTGYTAIVADLKLPVPAPTTESRIEGSVRRVESSDDHTLEFYSTKNTHAGDLRGHLHFALRNEATDLRVLSAAFKQLGPKFIRDWMLDEPTGAYARRAWFLYEFVTGQTLDLPNAIAGSHADVLNPKHHFVASRRTSTRHRIWDNLPGVPGFCPTIRRTKKLEQRLAESLDAEATKLAASVAPALLHRAVRFLFTKETQSTFEIEGERANPRREELFVAALTRAAQFDPTDKVALIELQNSIVDPRYAAKDWRAVQNYVGETTSGYKEVVHLICPRPQDVPELMSGWSNLCDRILSTPFDPVMAATLISFGFVFIHPFDDGNGRIHRFLIHSVLAKTGFSPKDVIFPISVAIVRDLQSYSQALERFSKPLLRLIRWRLTAKQELVVAGETADYYRYFDATPLAEYLYDRVAETVRDDLAKELDFLCRYDRAYQGVRAIVDMPNKKVSLFVRLCMSNGGRLAKGKRKLFPELIDDEIAVMEDAVQDALA